MMAGAMQVAPDYEENGRIYHGFRKGAYMFPCDEVRSTADYTPQDAHKLTSGANRQKKIAWTASTSLYTSRAEM